MLLKARNFSSRDTRVESELAVCKPSIAKERMTNHVVTGRISYPIATGQ
jgi:hypothetical protein